MLLLLLLQIAVVYDALNTALKILEYILFNQYFECMQFGLKGPTLTAIYSIIIFVSWTYLVIYMMSNVMLMICGNIFWKDFIFSPNVSNVFMMFSGWRCYQYSFGPNIYVCVPIWCQGCCHCSCYITVSSAIVSSDRYLCLFLSYRDGRRITSKSL